MNHRAARSLSLLLALISSALVFVLPQAWVADNGHVNHLLLVLMLSGIMIGFIHGIGFQSHNRAFRYLLHPVLAWLLMGIGLLSASYP